MPASRRLARSAGFTLLEIMVVVVIIATLTSLVLLSVSGEGSRDRELQREADRLAAVLRLAGEDAVLRSLELGLRVEPDGYSFVVLEEQAWRNVSGDGSRVLRPHRLPQGLELDIEVEGLEVELAGGDEQDEAEAAEEPHIVLLSSGELTPFRMTLGESGRMPLMVVEGHATGRIEVRRNETL